MTEKAHASRVHDEVMDYGETGYHGQMRETHRVWIAECSCGWVFRSGVAVKSCRSREAARLFWRDHAAAENHKVDVLGSGLDDTKQGCYQ